MTHKILVIADSEKMQQAIVLNLRAHWEVEPYPTQKNSAPPSLPLQEIQMLIIALSLPYSEPVVMLANTLLHSCIRYIPIIVISDRSFKDDEVQNIYHLDFPFDSEMLLHKVGAILTPVPAEVSVE